MTDKRFTSDYNGNEHLFTHFLENGKPMTKEEVLNQLNELYEQDLATKKEDAEYELLHLKEKYEELLEENEQLKKGMIEVVDRYIKNVECNPPSSTQTYMKIKRTLNNIREDLRSLIEDLE